MFLEHLRHDRRMPPFDLRSLCQIERAGDHFNTTNIVNDLKNLSVDPQFQVLRSLPRCKLTELDVHQTPLTLNEPENVEIVANRMVDIFPSLDCFHAYGLEGSWYELNGRISQLGMDSWIVTGELCSLSISFSHDRRS